MRHFIILLGLFLFFQESNAGKTDGSPDAEEASSKPTAPRPDPTYLQFSEKITAVSQKYDAYAYPVLLKEFRSLEFSEGLWKEIASKQSVEKWPLQTSWKIAVGAQCFLDAAIDIPHQNLLRNGLSSLLSWSFEEGGLEEFYIKATTRVYEIIQTHPYLRRRAALYALTAAARLQHPLARLFLTEALRCYDDPHDRFLSGNHSLVKAGLSSKKGQEALHRFIAFPGIEKFVDLKDERDLKDTEKLRAKAQLGLPRYHVLLGDLLYAKAGAQYHFPYPPEIIDAVIEQYKKAANLEDSEGCLKVSSLMNEVSNRDIESTQPLDLMDHYEHLSAWHGNEKAFLYVNIQTILKQENIPGTPSAIFKAVRKFLTIERRK